MARPTGKRRKRRNLDAPEALEEVLERAGENRFAKNRPPITSRDWRAAVGPRIADRARPLAIERGVLVVKVATSVWANELQMLAPELLARLRLRGIVVESLRFRVGALDLPERPPERRSFRKVPPPAELTGDLANSIRAVGDDELREAIAHAARGNLAWQSFVEATRTPRMAGASGGPPGARDPRAAGRESAPPARSGAGSGEASRRNSGDGGDRRR